MKAKKFTIEGTPRGIVANIGKAASIGQAAAIIETEKARKKREAAAVKDPAKEPAEFAAEPLSGEESKTLLEFVARFKSGAKEEKTGRINMKLEPCFINALEILCRVLKTKKTRFIEAAVKDAMTAKIVEIMKKEGGRNE